MVNRDSPPRRARRWYVQSDVGVLLQKNLRGQLAFMMEENRVFGSLIQW